MTQIHFESRRYLKVIRYLKNRSSFGTSRIEPSWFSYAALDIQMNFVRIGKDRFLRIIALSGIQDNSCHIPKNFFFWKKKPTITAFSQAWIIGWELRLSNWESSKGIWPLVKRVFIHRKPSYRSIIGKSKKVSILSRIFIEACELWHTF